MNSRQDIMTPRKSGNDSVPVAARRDSSWSGELLRHPLIRQLGELAAEATGLRLLIVYPTSSGWGQIFGDARAELQPLFCKLFQSAPDGAKHCRMCHILMSAAACGGGPTLQRCHAGASVVVCPAAEMSSGAVAIVSSCTFADPKAWKETSVQGKRFGIPQKKLRKAFLHLPKMSEPQRQMLELFMKAMTLAVQTIQQNGELAARLQSLEQGRPRERSLSQFLQKTDWVRNAPTLPTKTKQGHAPLLVRVICELVRQRPELPLTVKELATSARMTPNHFTSLFTRWTGMAFTDYLSEQRIERAKKLLGDLTLNVNEIARLSGYDDPGYFARRFRQITGLSPRQWREQASLAPATRKSVRRHRN